MLNPRILLLLLAAIAMPCWAEFEEAAVAYAMGKYSEALQTFLPLAQTANHPLAQYYLGIMHSQGQGVKQDDKEAAKWFTSAAQQGVPQAQIKLGEMYMEGKGGLPKDNEQAYAWFTVADHMGHKKAQPALATASQKLSPEELGAAKKLGEEYIKKYGQRPFQPKEG